MLLCLLPAQGQLPGLRIPPIPWPYRPDLPLQQLARARVGAVNEGAGYLRLLTVSDGALQALPGEERMPVRLISTPHRDSSPQMVGPNPRALPSHPSIQPITKASLLSMPPSLSLSDRGTGMPAQVTAVTSSLVPVSLAGANADSQHYSGTTQRGPGLLELVTRTGSTILSHHPHLHSAP